MTRANPNDMLPGLSFSTPSADVGTVGNPDLEPFLSDNIDLGFEYYPPRRNTTEKCASGGHRNMRTAPLCKRQGFT